MLEQLPLEAALAPEPPWKGQIAPGRRFPGGLVSVDKFLCLTGRSVFLFRFCPLKPLGGADSLLLLGFEAESIHASFPLAFSQSCDILKQYLSSFLRFVSLLEPTS